jgi:hypothetical protein
MSTHTKTINDFSIKYKIPYELAEIVNNSFNGKDNGFELIANMPSGSSLGDWFRKARELYQEEDSELSMLLYPSGNKLTLIYDPKASGKDILAIGDEKVLTFVRCASGNHTVGNDIFIIAARVAVKKGLRSSDSIELIISGKEVKIDNNGELSDCPEYYDAYTQLLFELI